jgi:ketosteroid isomerase-like protein
MAKWSRVEIEDAFKHFMAVTDRAFISGDLEEWVQCFTEDVSYREYGYGFNNGWDVGLEGRDAVREWINGHFARFPNNDMKHWPVPWYVIDEERGWLLCEWRNRMRDPGNGEIFEEPNYTRLKYGGNKQWAFEEDIYNPIRMRTMISLWQHTERKCVADGLESPDPARANIPQMHESVWEEEPESPWSRAEIEDALEHFQAVCNRAFLGGDREEWVQCFTEDVVYRELGFGFDGGWGEELVGQDAIRDWINSHCDVFPINHMKYFPISWYVIDEKRGWVVLEWRNQMDDPGDGKLYEEKSYTRLKYGGNKQWCFEEDIYSPLRMRGMLDRWLDTRKRLGGTLS